MKSIDKLNNAVIRQGKKALTSNAGQKFVNSNMGQKVKDTVHKAADKSKFVGDLTGINARKAESAVSDATTRLNRMKSNPTLDGHMKIYKRDLNDYYKAREKVLEKNKKLQKMQMNHKKMDKFEKKLDKYVKQEKINLDWSTKKLESLPEYETFKKIKSDRYNANKSFEKAVRDTRNSRRALTGGVLTTGIVAPPVIHNRNKKKQEQEELNRIRMSYM